MVFCLYKQPGETPLECLARFKAGEPKYAEARMTYAGRLDPMAEGLFVVLEGEDIDRKNEFLELPKTYYFEALLGLETDSYDLLGMPSIGASALIEEFSSQVIAEALARFVGKRTQAYPPYSSKTIGGVPLHRMAREGKTADIELPTREVEIYSMAFEEADMVSSEEVLEKIERIIPKVSGDFRQDGIILAWRKILNEKRSFQRVSARMDCSSGTYVRSLVHELGKTLGVGAVTYCIVRERVGEFYLSDGSLHFKP